MFLKRNYFLVCSVLWLLSIQMLWCGSVAEADILILQNGDRLQGEVHEDGETVHLKHPLLGDMTIPTSAVAERLLDELSSTEERLEQTELQSVDSKMFREQAPNAVPGLFGSHLLKDWTRRFSFGVEWEDGNNVSLDLNVAFRMSYKDADKKIKVSSTYYYETKDQVEDTNKGYLRFLYDWLKPDSKWFYFLRNRYDYDRFKSWEQRLAISGGPGYQFYDSDKFDMLARLGLGGTHVWGDENEFTPEGLAGFAVEWHPNRSNKLRSTVDFLQQLSDDNEYRVEADLVWEINLDVALGLNLELGLDYEYFSAIGDEAEDEKHYDIKYFTRLSLGF